MKRLEDEKARLHISDSEEENEDEGNDGDI